MKTKDELKYELLFEYEGEVNRPYPVSEGRVVAPVTGGSFSGPKLKGTILHGADWPITDPSGIVRPDVRILLQTDDNQFIHMYYTGVLIYPEGEVKDGVSIPDQDKIPFLRTNPQFEASGKYAWLNNIVTVGVGVSFNVTDTKMSIGYKVYQIL